MQSTRFPCVPVQPLLAVKAAQVLGGRFCTALIAQVICMNLMLPYDTGIVPWRQEDPGARSSPKRKGANAGTELYRTGSLNMKILRGSEN